MKIGYMAPAAQFPTAIFDGLRQALNAHEVVAWSPAEAPLHSDLEALVTLGPVTRELMASLPNLALVQTISDGYESIDVEAATEFGVRVSNAPADLTGNADSVAEYAVLLMLATMRKLPLALAALRDPSIEKPGRNRTLLGSQVCIVGMGMIGKKIADRLQPFGVQLYAVDRSPDHVPPHIPAYPLGRLKEAVAEADFVVLSVRATNENVHMIDAGVMAAMKPGAILINIARGSLVDESALYDAVKSGHLSAAGLDVEEHEPLPLDDPLLTLPAIFLTPHEAGLTELNIQGTTAHIVDVIARLEAGEPIISQLNRLEESGAGAVEPHSSQQRA
jgi:phosphoglycerate dehydrogenase-like enzyme